ncbi:MAG: restriction endonuclease subunit R, partial [Candidatus Parabeggiatoa sp. nov. 2]
SQTIRATDLSLHDLEIQFGLQLAVDDQFFPEWQTELPEITDIDKQVMNQVKASYFNLVKYPPLLEDTVKMAVLGPLLNICGFLFVSSSDEIRIFC